MKLHNSGAELFIPDNTPVEAALARTSHIGVIAHQDDLEMGCYHGIEQCFGKPEQWFAGVVVTNGAGSPRDALYASYTDEEMQQVRKIEQKKAASVGEYGAQFLLDYSSSAVKDATNRNLIEELTRIFMATRPQIVYTHNLADKHDTHVAVALRTIQALREMPEDTRPQAVYGCECWRDLDWLLDNEKVVFDVSARDNLAASLLGVFDSQICGGKRYDLAVMGRRRAHATMYASHATDTATSLIFAMDLTPLMKDQSLNIQDFVAGYIERLSKDVNERITKFSA